jgi:biuret amidohydrolase
MIDLSPRTPALLVVDAQNEFIVLADGDHGIPTHNTESALQNVTELLGAARGKIPVIFTQEVHRAQRVDFGRELDGDEPEHCIEGSRGAELHAAVGSADGDYVVPKRRYSAFFGTDLDILLRGLGVDTVIVCGFVTDVCVHYSCVDAHQYDYRYLVVGDAAAGTSQEAHAASLRALGYLQHGSVATTDEVIAGISARS